MSKFSDALRAHNTGERVIERRPIDVLEVSAQWREDIGLGTRYALLATVRADFLIRESAALRAGGDTSVLEETVKKARRLLIEEMFGEFRPLITKMERELLDWKIDDAQATLAQLSKQMLEE